MSVTNDFQPFAIGAGANVESQSAYLVDPALSLGQQPGIASSALNNKALRQGTVIASQLAQFVANITQTNVTDNGVSAQFLAQLQAAVQFMPPVLTSFTSTGSGTFNTTFYFFIATPTIAPTAGATYTNNSVTYTVSVNEASNILQCTGNGVPTTSGTLTKATGTGDAAITFYAMRAPIYIDVEMVGGGGGGGGSQGGDNGGNGGNTTFGSSLLAANGGAGGTEGSSGGGAGGTASLGSGPVGIAFSGGVGSGATSDLGGTGGSTPFGGAGAGGGTASGFAGVNNTGSGGGGGGQPGAGGQGGGAGGYVRARIFSPLYTYSLSVGVAGTASSGSSPGAAGGTGVVYVWQYYQ